MSTTSDLSPFLQGNYGPIDDERVEEALPVIGEIPRELEGMFVRNGPNPQFAPKGRYHWFDGDGMLHGVRLSKGRASYRNRYVTTQGLENERKAGRALYTGLAEPPDLSGELEGGPFKNAANTALVWHAGRFLALWEAGTPHQITLPELETAGLYDYAGQITHAYSAHPKIDPATGELRVFGYGLFPPFVQYAVVDAEGAVRHRAEIDLPGGVGVMMHDFAITERYVIFMELPVTFRLERLAEGGSPLAFERDLPSRFGVMPRLGRSEDVRWFEAPSCYVFHTANAREVGDSIELIACRMQETDVLSGAKHTPEETARMLPRLHQWSFDLRTGKTTERALDEAGSEFPRVSDARVGRDARYVYTGTVERGPDNAAMTGWTKYDLHAGTSERHRHGPGRFGAEGVFVARDHAQHEDDGWLVGYVHDERENRSELSIVDTRAFDKAPVARVLLPRRVPYGFHGAWVSEAQIARTLRSTKS